MTTFTDDFSSNTVNQTPGWTVWDVASGGNPPTVTGGELKPAATSGLNEIRMYHNTWAPEEDQNFVIFYKLSSTVSGEHTALCKLKILNGGAPAGGSEQYVKARVVVSSGTAVSDLFLEVRRSSGTTEILDSLLNDASLDHTPSEWHAVGVEVVGDDAYARWWHVGDNAAKDAFDPFVATPDAELGPYTLTGVNKVTFGATTKGTVGVRINADSTSHAWDRFTVVDDDTYTPNAPPFSPTPPFKAGNWPDETWTPHANDPYFGTDEAALTALPLANSQDIVDWMVAAGPPAAAFDVFLEIRAANIADTNADYNDAAYWAEPTDPLFTLKSNNFYGTFPYNDVQIRLPADALPAQGFYDPVLAPGKDSHLSVVQPDGTVWSIYKVISIGLNGYDDFGEFPGGKVAGEIHFRWGGKVSDIDGSANDDIGEGAVAANWNAMAGRIRPIELEQGEINHPLFIIVPCVQHPEIWPSQGNAQKCVSGNPGWGVGEMPRTGQWFRLNYTEAEIDALTAPTWRKAIWKAMAKHGMFVGDTKGANAGTTIGIESGTTYTAFGYTDPWVIFCEDRYGTAEGAGIRIGSDGYYELDVETGIDMRRLSAMDPFSLGEGTPPASTPGIEADKIFLHKTSYGGGSISAVRVQVDTVGTGETKARAVIYDSDLNLLGAGEEVAVPGGLPKGWRNFPFAAGGLKTLAGEPVLFGLHVGDQGPLHIYGHLGRTNLAPNPRLDDATGWFASGSPTTHAVAALGGSNPDSPDGKLLNAMHVVTDGSGDRSLTVLDTGDLTADIDYTGSMWVYVVSNSATVQIAAYLGATFASKAVVGTGSWQRVFLTFRPDTTDEWSFYIGQNGSGAAEWFHTGFLLEEADQALDYFDGTQPPPGSSFQNCGPCDVYWLGTEGDSASHWGSREADADYDLGAPDPVVITGTQLVPFANVLWTPRWTPPLMDDAHYARYAFPSAQSIFLPAPTAAEYIGTCGWHGWSFDPERGSFAVVREDGPMADLVGERLKVTYGEQSVAVYCHTSGDTVEDISLSRRLFMALAPAATTELDVVVEVLE